MKILKRCITLKEPSHSYGWNELLKVSRVAKSESDLLHHCNRGGSDIHGLYRYVPAAVKGMVFKQFSLG